MGKSLTEKDLEELRGCLDLGFEFTYEDIPELCNTLPALRLFSTPSSHLHPNWAISKPGICLPSLSFSLSPPSLSNFLVPGDDPEEVKARLRLWAQAVACIVRLCS